MNRKNKFLSAFFSLAIFFVCSLLFCACGSSVDMSSVKSADDIEREKNVSQYKPQPKKEEPKPQPTSKEPTRKTTETKPSSNPERTQPAPSVSHSQSDTYLPDFLAFSNNKAEFYKQDYDDNSVKAHYHIATVPGKYSARDIMQDYFDLITSKYNFKLIGHDNDNVDRRYGFIYTGTGSIKQFTENIVGHKDKINVRVSVWEGGNKGEIIIRYADGINYTDTGDRTRYQLQEVKHNPQTSGGSSDNFDYPSGPELKPTEITDVACARCSGLGYVEEFTYDTSTPHYDGSPPPAGVTIRKPCPDCGGSGRKSLNW